jgi:hypothetical protein
MASWEKRVDSGDWDAITATVNEYGGALLPRLVTLAEAVRLRRLYADDGRRASMNGWRPATPPARSDPPPSC